MIRPEAPGAWRPIASAFLCAGVIMNASPILALDIGFTSAQNKVFFEAPTEFAGAMTDTVSMSMAKHEYEAVQMVLFPDQNATAITVEVGPLTHQSSSVQLPASAIEVNLVGYVNQLAAKVPGDRIGWHPDPLLPNQAVDLAADTLQPYLITVRTEDSTHAGDYFGPIVIREDGIPVATRILKVTVWDFALPQVPTFKTTSLTFRSAPDDMWPGQVVSEAHRDTLIFRLADLGFKNRIPPTGALANGLDSWTWAADSGFTRYGYPTHDGDTFNAARTGQFIDYMLAKGANMFLIGYTFDVYDGCCDTTERVANLVKYLGDYYSYLASRNLLDMAYVYNIDEPWGSQVQHAKDIYTLIKTQVGSDLLVLQNTNQNNGSIIGDLLGYFDVMDINLGHYYINQTPAYRVSNPTELSEFWWNVNIWPDTHPNLFLEYSLVDARIFGPMSYKFNIQGFEYWNLKSQWSIGSYHPIDSNELRVYWNVSSRSLDGSLVYPGSNFDIYSSMRFESFRDGMEDYEYLKLLEAENPGHSLLNVGIVTDLTTFTSDPFEVQGHRDQVGQFLSSIGTGIDDGETKTPKTYGLKGNYPNPFNGATEIEFILDLPSPIELAVYNMLGQKLATLHSGALPAGRHEISWDGQSARGTDAPSGVYFYRLSAPGFQQTRKMLLLR